MLVQSSLAAALTIITEARSVMRVVQLFGFCVSTAVAADADAVCGSAPVVQVLLKLSAGR